MIAPVKAGVALHQLFELVGVLRLIGAGVRPDPPRKGSIVGPTHRQLLSWRARRPARNSDKSSHRFREGSGALRSTPLPLYTAGYQVNAGMRPGPAQRVSVQPTA